MFRKRFFMGMKNAPKFALLLTFSCIAVLVEIAN